MRQILLLVIIFIQGLGTLHAQHSDSTKAEYVRPEKHRKKFYKTRAFKTLIVPTILIGYGVSTIHDHGLYSSYRVYNNIHKGHFSGTHIDDYLQYSPYAELALLNIFQIKCKNDFINTSLLIIKSEILMNAIVFPLKKITHIVRPDSLNPARDRSFPSGHTANAFLAAAIVHQEYKHRSNWYGIGAYSLATSVGVFRMLNNRHWEADVFAGAGIGILAVHLSYLTHRYTWGRKCDATIFPTYQKGNVGLCFYQKF
jgi:membrane-associated phospholipid phosphatase